MKRAIRFVLLIVLCFPVSNGQDKQDVEKEKAGIRQAALDYAEGYYEGNAERMERAVHPLLCKRGLVRLNEQGEPFLVFMNSEMLIEAARSGRGKLDPEMRNITVTVLDLNENTASAKVFTAQFNDFLHLAKVNGAWKIVNVLWRTPLQKPTEASGNAPDEVRKTMTKFREAALAKDAERAKALIHPEVRQRAYAPGIPGGRMILQDLTGETLLQVVRMGRAIPPKDQAQPEDSVLDVYENIASVKSSRPAGVEYIHLAQQSGQWRIVNVLATSFQRASTAPR